MQKESLAKRIVDAVGGKENIVNITHCATRLRITVMNPEIVNEEAIKGIKEVMALVKQGGQHQLVIGRNVRDVYDEVTAYVGDAADGKADKKAGKKAKKGLWNSVFGAIIGCLMPLIPVLVGVGLGKCLLLLLAQFGFTAENQTYAFFTFVFDTGFTFLPVLIAFAAGKYFQMNQYLAGFLGCMLLHPSWTAMVAGAESTLGSIKLFGVIPVVAMNYSSTVIPAIMIVFVASKVYRFLDKHVPKMIRSLVVPLLTLLIMAPLSFVILAPLMTVLSLVISKVVMFFYSKFGMFAIAASCLLYPWLVSTGMHAALALAGIEMLGAQGFDPFTRTLTLCHNMSQAAASFAVGLKTKDKELKSTAFSASLTALLSGITEPSLYGVTLRLKKPMYACMIGGSVAGLYAGFVGLKAYAFLTPGLFALPMWMSENSGNNFANALITIVICMVVTFIAVLVIGFDDSGQEGNGQKKIGEKKADKKKSQGERSVEKKLASPVEGTIIPLEEVKDEAFAKGTLGKGMGIVPANGKICAPCDGVVVTCTETKHAIGIVGEDDVELLIHVGLDTVNLQGKYFTCLVKEGARVKQGDVLLEVDLDAIVKEGYDPTVVLVVTNSDEYEVKMEGNQLIVK